MGYAAEKYRAQLRRALRFARASSVANERYSNQRVRPATDGLSTIPVRVSHIVSMGMFEHVGSKNHRLYFECAHRNMRDMAYFLLHTIWENKRIRPSTLAGQYIFPNEDLPSVGEITTAVEGLFVVEDVHNFGPITNKTLMAWNEKFQSNRPEISSKHGDVLVECGNIICCQSAAAFRSRHISVGQFVLSPKGCAGI